VNNILASTETMGEADDTGQRSIVNLVEDNPGNTVDIV